MFMLGEFCDLTMGSVSDQYIDRYIYLKFYSSGLFGLGVPLYVVGMWGVSYHKVG